MYYAYLTVPNHEFEELFPQGVPTFGFTPDDFMEIYDGCTGELVDIEPDLSREPRRVDLGPRTRPFSRIHCNDERSSFC